VGKTFKKAVPLTTLVFRNRVECRARSLSLMRLRATSCASWVRWRDRYWEEWMKREVALHNEHLHDPCRSRSTVAAVCLECEKHGRKRSWRMHILWNLPRIWQNGLNITTKTSVHVSGLGAGNRKRKSWIQSTVTTIIKVRWTWLELGWEKEEKYIFFTGRILRKMDNEARE
jgi:hypothetical protein